MGPKLTRPTAGQSCNQFGDAALPRPSIHICICMPPMVPWESCVAAARTSRHQRRSRHICLRCAADVSAPAPRRPCLPAPPTGPLVNGGNPEPRRRHFSHPRHVCSQHTARLGTGKARFRPLLIRAAARRRLKSSSDPVARRGAEIRPAITDIRCRWLTNGRGRRRRRRGLLQRAERRRLIRLTESRRSAVRPVGAVRTAETEARKGAANRRPPGIDIAGTKRG